MESTIKLGEKEFPIAPRSLAEMNQVPVNWQIQFLISAPCFTRMGIDTPDGMAAQITIIYQAVKFADPEPKAIDGTNGVTLDQIREAVTSIGKLIGLEIKDSLVTG